MATMYLTLMSAEESYRVAEERKAKHTGCACTSKLTLPVALTRFFVTIQRDILNSLKVANCSPASKTTHSRQSEFLKQITTVLSCRCRLAAPRHCKYSLQSAIATCYFQRRTFKAK